MRKEEGERNLAQVQRGAFSTIVIIAIHVEDLLSLDGEDSGQNALSQSSSQHNNVILLILIISTARRKKRKKKG